MHNKATSTANGVDLAQGFAFKHWPASTRDSGQYQTQSVTKLGTAESAA